MSWLEGQVGLWLHGTVRKYSSGRHLVWLCRGDSVHLSASCVPKCVCVYKSVYIYVCVYTIYIIHTNYSIFL